MRLSAAVQIVARRVGLRPGRVSATASRLQHAGMLPITEGNRRYPPDVDIENIVDLFLAAVADRGIGVAAETAKQIGSFTSDDGFQLRDIVVLALSGRSSVDHLIIRDDGASAVVDSTFIRFGASAEPGAATRVTTVPGQAINAIAAELAGASPAEADAIATITQIRRAAFG